MKNIHKINKSCFWLCILFFVMGFVNLCAQGSINPFTPRTSMQAPREHQGKSIYKIRGDFTMIGNSNAFGRNYSDTGNNSGVMRFVNVEPGNQVVNSSTSDFVLPSTIDGKCVNIVFAGLYWTGRGQRGDSQILPNGLDKKRVKFKAPGKEYIDLYSDEIFFSTYNEESLNMYAGFYDVTNIVREAGTGTYAVANIATRQGRDNIEYVNEYMSGIVGFYAGWGMVIVYENADMKWRDITVFDGFANIFHNGHGNYTFGELNVSGFHAAENGEIKIRMGMMAGEGDVSIPGDFFQIRKRNSFEWETLRHFGNTPNNFFNSSIQTGGNPRNPNRRNNYGIDMSMFELDNSNNSIIANNQTSTRFRFGSSQDAYSIFNITFAVDATIPDIEVLNESVGIAKHNDSVKPGDFLDFESSVYNVGSDAVENSIIKIPLPPNVHFVEASVELGAGTVSWEHPNSTNPNITPGGTIVWNLGNINLPDDKKQLLAKLKYKLRVVDDCTILMTSVYNCGLSININGTVSGQGMISKHDFEADFLRAYDAQPCDYKPIKEDYNLNINLDEDYISNCNETIKSNFRIFSEFCNVENNSVPINVIADAYPAGTKFYGHPPGTLNYEQSLISDHFYVNPNGDLTLYYALLEGSKDFCYLNLSIFLEKVNSKPIVSKSTVCLGEEINPNIELSAEGKTNDLSLYYYLNADDDDFLTTMPTHGNVGEYTYYVAEGKEKNGILCIGPKVSFTIVVEPLPNFIKNLDDFYVCIDKDKTVSIQATAVTSIIWEFYNKDTDLWEVLTTASFNNKLYANGLNLIIMRALEDFNDIRVRVSIENSQGCKIFSNEATIKVKLCNIPINPMIRVKTNKTI